MAGELFYHSSKNLYSVLAEKFKYLSQKTHQTTKPIEKKILS